MTVSAGEKLILAMLCDIHQGLNLQGTVDPARVRAALASDANVEDLLPGAGASDPTAEVSAILEMWSLIERGYKHLTAVEKEQVEAEAGPLGRGVRFSGFDSITESGYRTAAHALIEELGRFDRFQGRNLSAHMPCLDGYRRMLILFAPMRTDSAEQARLNVRQIIDLANAEKHPG